MTRPSHHLPFPVHSTADLDRAVRYPELTPDAKKAVIVKAKTMGRLDMIPASWLPKKSALSTTTTTGLDRLFEQKAEEHGISCAKLKAVYFRGVDEFTGSDFSIADPVAWGLARVQRFINCVRDGDMDHQDADLLETHEPAAPAPSGANICVDASAVVADVLYSDASRVAELFSPAQVEYVGLDDDTIHVWGIVNGSNTWHYTIDTSTGAYDLAFE